MKKNKTKLIFYTLLTLFTTLSCSKYVEDLNVDPNKFLDSSPEVMFQGMLLANQYWQKGQGLRIAMIWMNQSTGSDRQYVALNNWNSVTAPELDGTWNFAYVNTISQAQLIIKKAKESNNLKIAGAAQIIEAHSLGMVASLWGDIPYSQANQREAFPNPKYDSQESVYEAALKLLDEGIENLGEKGEIKGDLYYNGDETKWIALAHSIKARFYLHLKKYPEANTEALSGIASGADDMIAPFKGVPGQNMNPFFEFMVYQRDGYLSAKEAYCPDLLNPSSNNYRGNSKTNETARFAFMYSGDSSGNYDLNLGGKFAKAAGLPLVTYGEMLLVQAEAQARDNFADGLTAYNAYRALINTGYSIPGEAADIKYDPYTAADFDNGGIENPDNVTNQEALLREIMQERYIYFMADLEAFNDFKRTQNEAEIKLKPGFDGTPQRFLYPQTEINSNSSIPNPIPDVTTPTPVNKE